MADPFAELSRLIANIGGLSVETVAADITPTVDQVLDAQYEGGRGPDGQPWASKADGKPSHLQKSGDMRRATKGVPGVKGVSVRIPKPGGFHQGGTVSMDARPLVPSGDSLPPDWEKPIAAAASASLERALRK